MFLTAVCWNKLATQFLTNFTAIRSTSSQSNLKNSIVWAITPCCSLKVDRRFRGTCQLYLQIRNMSEARNQREVGSKQFAAYYLVEEDLRT